jgi:lantibiotic biosynthesis protein
MDIRLKAYQQSEKITGIITAGSTANDALFGGELGVALYCYYLYEASGKEAYGEMAVARLEEVLVRFGEGKARLHGPWYCNGTGGLYYLMVLFAGKGLLGRGIKKVLKQLGSQLLDCAVEGIENDYNDFVHGAFGLLHCFNMYAAFSGDDSLLQPFLRLVEKKYLLAKDPWIVSAIGHADEKQQVNLSLAHGQAGQLILLMKAYSLAGITAPVKNALQRNVDYLLQCKADVLLPGSCNFFPASIHLLTGAVAGNKRLAWCYGDLGPVLSLYKAADFFNSSGYRTEADNLCIKTTERTDYETTLLESAQVCHGTGGVAHFYHLLAELSGLDCCTQSAAYWMEQAVNSMDEEIALIESAGRQFDVIEGLPGMGLVLLSCLSGKKPDWGKMILLE